MSESIIIAIIGASGVVIAALITGLLSLFKKDDKNQNNPRIKQFQKGKNNTQIGIQNNSHEEDTQQ